MLSYNQGDIDAISQVAASDGIKERGGLKKIYSEPAISRLDEITQSLEQLRVAFESSGFKPDDTAGILLTNRNHAIGVTWQPQKETSRPSI